ncbi:MAG TPA: 6-phosphogluconolactonase [Candidatus Acidoferrales bacterium]|nr:6-phosphogluconolactonase [Candidatus Acidoferrales bacterium]
MSDRGELKIYPDAQAVAAATADLFIDVGRQAIAQRGAFRVALSGGSTPRAAYELLAQPPRKTAIDWSAVHVYFGDERCVPPDDPESNFRMAHEAFLDAVPLPKENVNRIRGEADPGHAANEYASLLRTELGQPPHFDLVLLGLGPDGHTASLFPGSAPDTDDNAMVRAVYAKSQDMWRVTVTPKVINAAAVVAFVVEGDAKSEILEKVYAGPVDVKEYPAQIVRPQSGRLLWIVDRRAAELIHS